MWFILISLLALRSTSGLSGQFLQVTDLHLDLKYQVNSNVEQTRCHAKNGTAGSLGSRVFCDSPLSLVSKSLQYIAAETDPDFILLTGDFARHDDYAPIPRTWAEILEENTKVAQQVASLFPGIPVVPSIGNNDVYPHDSMAPPGPSNTVLPGLAKAWEPLLHGSMHQQMLAGGWMSRKIGENVVVSLNTLYPAYEADCNETDSVAVEMMGWVDAILQNEYRVGHRVIIIGHVPPNMWKPQCRALYASMCIQYADTIQGQIFGHVHSDQFHFLNSAGAVDSGTYALNNTMVVAAAPSLVPTFNPSYRVWDYDPPTFTILDYTQYFAPLDALYSQFAFRKEYSMLEAYNVNSGNLSDVGTWIKINANIENSLKLSLRYEFYKYVSIITPPKEDDFRCVKRPYC